MNDRQRKKQENRIMKNDIIYLKLFINKNDRYNPVIKCRGFGKFFKKAMYLSSLYHCDIGYANPSIDKRIEDFESKRQDKA